MRERLIDLLNKTISVKDENTDDYIEWLAEELLANGVIVPPCKVGDVVYAYCSTFGVILPYMVGNFHIGFLGKDRNYYYFDAASYAKETDELLDELDFDLEELGKTVFLSREEAEKALERGGE